MDTRGGISGGQCGDLTPGTFQRTPKASEMSKNRELLRTFKMRGKNIGNFWRATKAPVAWRSGSFERTPKVSDGFRNGKKRLRSPKRFQ